jgi:hypothetical protein
MNLIRLETRDQSRIDICSYFCCGFDLVLTQPWLILYETCFSSVSGFICNMTNINSLGIAKYRILSLVISFQMLLFECSDSFGFYAVLVFCLLSLSLKPMWLTTTSRFDSFISVRYCCIRVDGYEICIKFNFCIPSLMVLFYFFFLFPHSPLCGF